MYIGLLVIGLIIFVVVFRLIAGSLDGDRVEQYIRDMEAEKAALRKRLAELENES